jgi:hypothetical protein
MCIGGEGERAVCSVFFEAGIEGEDVHSEHFFLFFFAKQPPALDVARTFEERAEIHGIPPIDLEVVAVHHQQPKKTLGFGLPSASYVSVGVVITFAHEEEYCA